MIQIIIFLTLFSFGAFCLAFGIKLLANCANISATLDDNVNALLMIAAGLVVLTEAYFRCPFMMVLK